MTLAHNFNHIINIALVVLLIIFLVYGYKKGFVSQVLTFLGLGVALFIAWLLYRPFGLMFAITPRSIVPFQMSVLGDFFYTKINSFVWFIIITLIAFIIIKLLKPIVEALSKAPVIRFFDGLAGMLLSFIFYALIVIGSIFVLSLPVFSNGQEMIERSGLKYVEHITGEIANVFEEDISRMQSVQTIAFEPVQASPEDVKNVMKYLDDNGVLLSRVNEFLKEIEIDVNE